MTREYIIEFARKIKDKPIDEQKRACFALFDEAEKNGDMDEVLDLIHENVSYDNRPYYVPGLFDEHPNIHAIWSTEKINEKRAKKGLPPIGAK